MPSKKNKNKGQQVQTPLDQGLEETKDTPQTMTPMPQKQQQQQQQPAKQYQKKKPVDFLAEEETKDEFPGFAPPKNKAPANESVWEIVPGNRPQTAQGPGQAQKQQHPPKQAPPTQAVMSMSQSQTQQQQPAARPQTQQQQVAQFAPRPTASKQAKPSGRTCKVVSNQYRIQLKEELQLFQYAIHFEGIGQFDSFVERKLVAKKRSEFTKCFGPRWFAHGHSIYMTSAIEEDVFFDVKLEQNEFRIAIDQSTEIRHTLKSFFQNAENDHQQTLLNLIIKAAVNETNMKQIGKRPNFFDIDHPKLMPGNIMVWQGFKASAYQSQMGLIMGVDAINKFMTTQTCLATMQDIKAKYGNKFQEAVDAQFKGKSIIANWGNKRTYIVDAIEWTKNPTNLKFPYNDQTITLEKYYKNVYDLPIKDKNQPLFRSKVGGMDIYLPPEHCMLDGVPDAINSSREMRDALASQRIKPMEKMKRVEQMAKMVMAQKALLDWGLLVDKSPSQITAGVLDAPKIIGFKTVIQCNEQELRRIPIQTPIDLLHEEWVFIYEGRLYDQCNNVVTDFKKASKKCDLTVEDPYFIETKREDDMATVQKELILYMTGTKKFRHPKMVVILLGKETNYPMYKKLMQQYRQPSQCITRFNANKFNLSKATNILRQINSKMGGDLYQLQFPKKMDSMLTMLVGIDVCHAGSKSIVGIAATVNPQLSQYYSNYVVQPKGQEIVKAKLADKFKEAIDLFSSNHNGKQPQNFIIYRDGVGDAQRAQIVQAEIKQLENTIKDHYNAVAAQPKITVIFVNKRINQRFFLQDQRGQLQNPPTGCIIDEGITQTTNENKSDQMFDFYMTPAETTQGCCLPTHFYVTQNQSPLNRLEIEQLTFALCHFYFNWAGPIKVPAPCQYANKIAYFFNILDVSKQALNCTVQHAQLENDLRQHVRPLNEKLHFL